MMIVLSAAMLHLALGGLIVGVMRAARAVRAARVPTIIVRLLPHPAPIMLPQPVVPTPAPPNDRPRLRPERGDLVGVIGTHQVGVVQCVDGDIVWGRCVESVSVAEGVQMTRLVGPPRPWIVDRLGLIGKGFRLPVGN